MSETLPKVNTHIHLPPNFSAFNTVDEAIDQAAFEGVSILGSSNYYDFTVYDVFAKKASDKGIQALFGIEIVSRIAKLADEGVKINDPGNPGKMYICGKAIRKFRQPTARAAELLGVIRNGDQARMDAMVDLLRQLFNRSGIETSIDAPAIVTQVAKRFAVSESTVVLQERHVAQAFQELLFKAIPVPDRSEKLSALFGAPSKSEPTDAVGVQAEIRTHLMKAGRPAYVDERFVTYEQARELIAELDGILCYPIIVDGMSPISQFEETPEGLVRRLKDLEIHWVEFVPNRNSPQVLSEYVKVLHANGFALAAGTEHNTTERIPIVPHCKGGEPVPEAAQALFVQGALDQCAHQRSAQEVE
ncbi:MAG: hypothetical protein P4L46_18895 [Fimbriimonas sp.]|nr:hypothetical protein [Fimbriimonas sp.]